MKYRSAAITDGRGSIGGTVYSRNRFGLYQRSRVAPVQPRTSKQVNNRALFANISRGWNSVLTPTQRAEWNAVAPSATFIDSLGQPYNPTGKQLLQSVQTNAINAGLQGAPFTGYGDPITPFAQPGAVTGIAIAPVVGPPAHTLTMTWTDPTLATNEVIIFATAPLSPGTTFVRSSLLKLIGHALASAAQPLNLDALYQAVFTSLPPSGSRIGIKTVVVDHTSGYASAQAFMLYTLP